jgi:Ydr279p protein triple barrel domain
VIVGHGLHRECTAESVLLPHPATGNSAAFLLAPADGGLLELNHMKSEFTSWFVGDTVVEGACVRKLTAVTAYFPPPRSD